MMHRLFFFGLALSTLPLAHALTLPLRSSSLLLSHSLHQSQSLLLRWSVTLSKLMALISLMHSAIIIGLLAHPVEYLIVSNFLSMMGWLGIATLTVSVHIATPAHQPECKYVD